MQSFGKGQYKTNALQESNQIQLEVFLDSFIFFPNRFSFTHSFFLVENSIVFENFDKNLPWGQQLQNKS